MASTSKCKYCGAVVRSDQKNCPGCGAPNELYVVDTPRRITKPKTIEELQEYCAERGMPLLRMRFFIGEDFREPRAFGIYRDGKDVVVYKNKADGSRAIRYRGPDEKKGVNELYLKLLEECHNRGIYPDGKPQGVTRSGGRKSSSQKLIISLIVLAVYAAIIGLMIYIGETAHRNDGYYISSIVSDRVYYRYGDDWYYSDTGDYSGDWTSTSVGPGSDYKEYYVGEDWDSDWGVTNFKTSDTWDDISSSSSDSDSGSSYDSWDSGGTDWDSDW